MGNKKISYLQRNKKDCRAKRRRKFTRNQYTANCSTNSMEEEGTKEIEGGQEVEQMGREGGETEAGEEMEAEDDQQEMEPTDEQEEMEASEPLSTSGRKSGASMLEEKNIRDEDKGVRNGYVLFDTSILVTLLEENVHYVILQLQLSIK